MEKDEAKILNNQYVNYMVLTIIFSGILLAIWILNLGLRFTQSGNWFLEGGILFLALSVFWYFRIKKIREILDGK